MDVLYLNREQIESMRIPFREVIDAVEEGLVLKGEGFVQIPPRPEIHPRKDCFIHAMPALLGGMTDMAGIKWVSGYYSNIEKGLPYILGFVILNDTETGAPLAIMDCGWITAYRTGAATAVAARNLAPERSSTLSIIGLGVQGRAHLLVLRNTLKELKKVKVHDINEEAARKFYEELQPVAQELDIEVCPDARSAVTGADIVVTCTPVYRKPERFIPAEWLKKDSLAVAVDYDCAFEADVMTGASVFVTDDREQYLWMKGSKGYFGGYPERVETDLGEICAGIREVEKGKGRKAAVLMGIASHDIATAKVIYEKACRTGLGTRLPF